MLRDVPSPINASPLRSEKLVRVANAAGIVQELTGVAVSPNTPRNWSTNGVNGEYLEVLRVGGQRLTSRQAIERFLRKLGQL